jgi:hypothetical protein
LRALSNNALKKNLLGKKKMTKKEIRSYLRIYWKIKDKLTENTKEIIIGRSGRKIRLLLKPEVYKLKICIEEILHYETEPLVIRMITSKIIKGYTDRMTLKELPLSESTYYRWKQKLIEKIYEWFIYFGEVSKEEILRESIAE